jgi:hypothetical protein
MQFNLRTILIILGIIVLILIIIALVDVDVRGQEIEVGTLTTQPVVPVEIDGQQITVPAGSKVKIGDKWTPDSTQTFLLWCVPFLIGAWLFWDNRRLKNDAERIKLEHERVKNEQERLRIAQEQLKVEAARLAQQNLDQGARQDRQMQDIREVKDATNGLQAKVAIAEHAKGKLEGQEEGRQIARDLKEAQTALQPPGPIVAENIEVTGENVEVKRG